MAPRRVLVTGAAGFVGVHTVATLLREPQNFIVRALVRSPQKLAQALAAFGISTDAIELALGDITDAAAVKVALSGCDAVVHAAGFFAYGDPAAVTRMQETNVEGTRCVLTQAADAGMDPIVHVSSYLAQFPPRGKIQTADDPVTQPGSPYARTKADAERVARALQESGAPVVILYPGAIQGPLDPTFGATPAYVATAIRDRNWLVTSAGRCYIDVRDVAALVRATLVPGLGPRRFMCGGPYETDAAVLALLRELTGRDIRAQRVPDAVLRVIGRLGDLYRRLTGRQPRIDYDVAMVLTRSVPCDDAAAMTLLGRPFREFRDSMEELLVWMRHAGHLSAEEAGPVLTAKTVERYGDGSQLPEG